MAWQDLFWGQSLDLGDRLIDSGNVGFNAFGPIIGLIMGQALRDCITRKKFFAGALPVLPGESPDRGQLKPCQQGGNVNPKNPWLHILKRSGGI
jgi:hypothetical protein